MGHPEDRNLKGPNSRLVERFDSLLLSCRVYQIEPLVVKDNLIRGVRNVQKDLKMNLKGNGSLDGPNSRLLEGLKVF